MQDVHNRQAVSVFIRNVTASASVLILDDLSCMLSCIPDTSILRWSLWSFHAKEKKCCNATERPGPVKMWEVCLSHFTFFAFLFREIQVSLPAKDLQWHLWYSCRAAGKFSVVGDGLPKIETCHKQTSLLPARVERIELQRPCTHKCRTDWHVLAIAKENILYWLYT